LVAVPGFGQAAFVLEDHQCCAKKPGQGLESVEKAEDVVIAYVDHTFKGGGRECKANDDVDYVGNSHNDGDRALGLEVLGVDVGTHAHGSYFNVADYA